MALTRSLAAFAAAAALAGACRARQEARAPEPPPGEAWLTEEQVREARLRIEPLAEHPVGGPVVAAGKIAFDDLAVAHVFSPVTGRVTRVVARPGDRVRRGAPLAIVESPDMAQAKAELVKADADLLAAQAEHRRQQELFEARAGSRRDLESALDAFTRAGAEQQRARGKMQLLGASAGGDGAYVLRSPIEGEVLARNVGLGMEIAGQYAAGQAVELFTVGELDPVWVLADVSELDLPRLATGARVKVTVSAYPDRAFQGRLDWIAGALDPVSRMARVRSTLANPGRDLKAEMYCTVEIEGKQPVRLALPRTAVLRLGDQTVAFVEAGRAPDGRRRFERRPVAVEEGVVGEFVPVLRGAGAGEPVVTSGAILLSGLM